MAAKTHPSIRWKVFLYLMGFVGVLLALLWTFQIVFLEDFYTKIKVHSIESQVDTIIENIDDGDLKNLLDHISWTDNFLIRVVDPSGQILEKAGVAREEMQIHTDPEQLKRDFERTLERGVLVDDRKINLNKLENGGKKLEFKGDVSPFKQPMQLITYREIVQKADGSQVMVVIDSMLTPLAGTVETLRIQLVCISVLMVLLAAGMAVLLSRKVSRPIVSINTAAKELAKGQYDVTFAGGGYQEVDELAGTLNYAARELGRTDQLRRELVANVGHDLRTPLTLITGYAEVMQDLPGENTPENLQIIIDEARRLSALVSDILDLSKLESGVQKMDWQPVALTQSIRSILTRYSRLVSQDGYQIQLQAQEEVWVQGDEVRLEQVIYNLVNNAIHYTGADKNITITQTVDDGWVTVTVVDTGEGIAPEQLPLIWDRYYKIDKNHRQSAVGTGLGLSIVKGVLEQHHARYGVDSVVGEGSRFWFALPVLSQDAPPALEGSQEE